MTSYSIWALRRLISCIVSSPPTLFSSQSVTSFTMYTPKTGGVFSNDMIDAYIALKYEEVQRFRMTTHPVEFDMYYSS